MEKTQDIALDIYPRNKTGRSAAYQTRKAGHIPAVIYGPQLSRDGKGINVGLQPQNFLKVYKSKGKSAIVTVNPKEGAEASLASQKFLVEDIQTHPLRNEVIHVDLQLLDLKKPIRVVVPLHFVGKAKGTIEGGILSILNREVEIKALPEDIPSHIDVDVTPLDLNESLKIEELAKSGEQKYEVIYESSFALVAVLAPEDEVKATPVAEAVVEGAAEGAAAEGAAKKEGDKS